MARMAQSVPDKVDRPGRVMTRDYDNRSRIPSSARCIVPSPPPPSLPSFSWHSRSTAGLIPHPGVYVTLCFVFSISSSCFPLIYRSSPPLSSSRAFRVSSSLLPPLPSPMRAFLEYCLSTRSLYSTLFIYRALRIFISYWLQRKWSPCDSLRACI